MALLQVNYLSKTLFRTVPLNMILPSDKIDYETLSYKMKGEKSLRHCIFFTDFSAITPTG